jgi:hypothetical protein
MANLWPFYIKRWRWQMSFCDDINLSSMTIPKRWRQLPHYWWRQHQVIADISTPSHANAVNGRLWPKHRNICDQIWSSHLTNTVNGTVRRWGTWRIMMITELYPWPTTFIIDWIHFYDENYFVMDYRHICDEKTHFVTDAQMWRQFCYQMNIVTKLSQMTTCDHFGAFGDVKGMLLMTTSLLVVGGWWVRRTSLDGY